ncbi:hypothetical protein BH09BAC6_BH09BAC6_27070 [soil metagenome]|jgi:hypothetical protein
MSNTEIDVLTTDFYKAISFTNGIVPDVTNLEVLFVGGGILLNNSFAEPILFTAESLVQALETQVAASEVRQLTQREISAKTEIFGKVAQRISVYEYSYADHEVERMPKGVNYMQFAKVGDNWRIVSMVWDDENQDQLIPHEYLIGGGE